MIVRVRPRSLAFGLRTWPLKGFLLGYAIAVAPIMQTVSAAADLRPAVAPTVPYVPIMFNWTGFHIQANIGRSWARASITNTLHRVRFGVGHQSVFVRGSQIGYSEPISPTVVLGIESLIDGIQGDRSSSNALVPGFGDLFEAFAREDFVTTLTGRVGFAAPGWDHWLVYVKGRGWAETQAVVTDLGTGAAFSTTGINSGWLAGVGLEWAFAPKRTARIDQRCLGLSGFPPSDEQPSHSTPSPPRVYGIASNTFDGGDVNARMLSNWSPRAVVARY
jgi:outer membrane immunogenic protein